MLRDLLSHQKRIEDLLRRDRGEIDWDAEYKYLTDQLLHLQRERQLHLIVTASIGLACLLMLGVTWIKPMMLFTMLGVILLVMFTAYIFHYRKLENSVQGWYRILNEIHKKIVNK